MAKRIEDVSSWMGHIVYLASRIGPRSSTTRAERRGSEYCQTVLSDLGFNPVWERFCSARSIYQPHLLAAAMVLLSFALHPLQGRHSALVAADPGVAAMVEILGMLALRQGCRPAVSA